MSANRMAAAALLISVFVAGGVAGVAVWQVVDREPDRFEQRDERFGFERRGPRAGPDGMRGPRGAFAPMMFARHLAEELDLDEEQLAAIEGIIEEREAMSAELLRELRPRLEGQLDSMNTAIRELLTAEQQVDFDEFLESSRARFMRPDGRFDRDGRRGPDRRGRAPRS